MARRKFQKEKRVTVKLEEELHTQAFEKAEKKGMTLSEVIRRLLKRWLKGEVDVSER
jgi:antitoxin component of RelBE/YafQ-DinJ toxin-antitoxin module